MVSILSFIALNYWENRRWPILFNLVRPACQTPGVDSCWCLENPPGSFTLWDCILLFSQLGELMVVVTVSYPLLALVSIGSVDHHCTETNMCCHPRTFQGFKVYITEIMHLMDIFLDEDYTHTSHTKEKGSRPTSWKGWLSFFSRLMKETGIFAKCTDC